MSISSVRNAILAAFSDKRFTLEEAENVSGVAARTNGIDSGEQKEITKALTQAGKFDAGVKAHLSAVAADKPAHGTALADAVKQVVDARGLDVLTGAEDADSDTFGDPLVKAIDAFAAIHGNVGGDELRTFKLKVAGATVIMATDWNWDKNKELVGFFDTNGKELARAVIETKNDPMPMFWVSTATNKKGAPIGTPTSTTEVKVPAGFAKAVEAYADKKGETGDDLGTEIATNKLPPLVRRRMEFMHRTIADPTSADTVVLNGVRLYVLNDYSSVTTNYFYTADGKLHYNTNG